MWNLGSDLNNTPKQMVKVWNNWAEIYIGNTI